MRKLSILALVVILAGAFAVAGYGESTDQATVNFGTTQELSITVTDGENVDFGNELNPSDGPFYKIKTTTLKVESNLENWEVTTGISGDKPSVLSVKFKVGNLHQFDTGNLSYTGSGDESGIKASYKLHDVESLNPNTNYTNTVTFTASTN